MKGRRQGNKREEVVAEGKHARSVDVCLLREVICRMHLVADNNNTSGQPHRDTGHSNNTMAPCSPMLTSTDHCFQVYFPRGQEVNRLPTEKETSALLQSTNQMKGWLK